MKKMREFYTKVLLGLFGLLILSVLVGYLCFERTFLSVELLPSNADTLPWQSKLITDVANGGTSVISVDDDKFSLSFNFILTHKAHYPNAAIELRFSELGDKSELVDLSPYDHLSFSVKCVPDNILMFNVSTFEEKFSILDDPLTYRSPSSFFSCNENWSHIDLDLTRLQTPQWWFEAFNLDLSKKEYKLDKVSKMSFGTSSQSAFDVDAKVQLQKLVLTGRDWFYMYVFWGAALIAWSSFAFWFFRQHTHVLVNELRDKIQRDRPLVAYQQLSMEPHRDKDKKAILHFLATNYSNPELNLESMSVTVGVSRTKINDILKDELGFTFTGYINKLRLTEAARLLTEKEDANIAEIAYSVGYKNVSYFNKLFREEYNCTPKSFKSLSEKASN